MPDVVTRLAKLLDEIEILPRRMWLTRSETGLTVPLLRGVWGAALHGLDRRAYQEVFRDDSGQRGYLIRPWPTDEPVIEFVLLGDGLEHDQSLMRAWDVAAGMGYGPRREQVFIERARRVEPDGSAGCDAWAGAEGWRLCQAPWPLGGNPERTAARLRFDAPLRLMRDGELIRQPSFADIVVASLRRLSRYIPESMSGDMASLRKECVSIAKETRSGAWQGTNLHLRRYSGSQKVDLELRGVAGELDLPQGPGPLWPLILAASWLHIGKSTIVGLGRCLIEAAH